MGMFTGWVVGRCSKFERSGVGTVIPKYNKSIAESPRGLM